MENESSAAVLSNPKLVRGEATIQGLNPYGRIYETGRQLELNARRFAWKNVDGIKYLVIVAAYANGVTVGKRDSC